MDPKMMQEMMNWMGGDWGGGAWSAGGPWQGGYGKGKGKGKMKGKGKGKKGKPELTEEEKEAKKKRQEEFESKLLAGIVAGLRRAGGKLQLAQIGAFPEVKQCRAEYEKEMKELSLHTWISKNDMTFKMDPDPKVPTSTAANIVALVNIHDGAQLLDADLPPSIDRTSTIAEKWMALRKMILRVVERNGGRCQVQLLGQEHAINQMRKGLWGAAKLQDFVRKFAKNFQLDTSISPPMIVLVSSDEGHEPQGGWPDEARIAADRERFVKPKGEKRPFSAIGGSSSSVPTAQDRTVRLSQSAMQQASIAQASGNLTGAQYILQLVQLLQDQSPQVSGAAVEQLRQLGIQ